MKKPWLIVTVLFSLTALLSTTVSATVKPSIEVEVDESDSDDTDSDESSSTGDDDDSTDDDETAIDGIETDEPILDSMPGDVGPDADIGDTSDIDELEEIRHQERLREEWLEEQTDEEVEESEQILLDVLEDEDKLADADQCYEELLEDHSDASGTITVRAGRNPQVEATPSFRVSPDSGLGEMTDCLRDIWTEPLMEAGRNAPGNEFSVEKKLEFDAN